MEVFAERKQTILIDAA